MKNEQLIVYPPHHNYKLKNIKFNFNLDETSIKPAMILEYSKCKLGKRCN